MLTIGIIIVIGIVAFVIIKGKKKSIIPTKDVEMLELAEILQFFKRPDILAKLKADSNLLAVAIKENSKNGTIHIVASLFNKEKEKIDSINKEAVAWNAKKLDDRLIQLFGDRDMIILK